MFLVATPDRGRNAALVTLLSTSLLVLASFSSLAARSVTLAWDPSAGTSVAGYNLYCGGASGAYTNIVDAGNATNATIAGLTEGATYFFAATAYDSSALESDFSNEISYTVPAAENTPPTLDSLANLTISENAALQTVNLSGISSGAANESQTLTVTASSSNTGLIPNPTVSYTSPNATGSIAFTPLANAYGSATITVTVNDGGASNNIVSRSFSIAVNQLPTISAIPNRVIAVGTSTPPIPFTVGDAETSPSSLTLSASSSDLSLVQNANIVLGGSGASRTVAVTPLPGQSGDATITITVGDGSVTATSSFLLSVRPRPEAPGNFRVAQVLP